MKTRDPINVLALAVSLCAALACKTDRDAFTADASSVKGDDSGTATGHDAGASGEGSATHVTIADGQLEGVVDGKTRKFLGIPYAKPPVGELRWKLPQKNDKWSGVRDASMFGPRCAQLASATLMNAASEEEDCLYLNVWTPEPAAKQALPVMVWIHGGGNVNGSASEPVPFLNSGVFYSGQTLSEKGVVVVTFNYRLGAFGFLAHADLGHEDGSNPGNQGLYDQTQALQWVHDNVAEVRRRSEERHDLRRVGWLARRVLPHGLAQEPRLVSARDQRERRLHHAQRYGVRGRKERRQPGERAGLRRRQTARLSARQVGVRAADGAEQAAR